MDLNGALVFVNVVNAGSFTKAARVLGLPISTVSGRVAALERSLGVTLLTRTTRKLRLTDMGREFFLRAEVAVSALLQAGEDASQAQKRPTGTLRMTIPSELLSQEVAESIIEYRARFPDARVEAYATNRYVDLIEEGYDLAVRSGAPDSASLIARRIAMGRMCLAASPKYLNAAPALATPEDLSRHQCLALNSSGQQNLKPVWELHSAAGRLVQVRPSIVFSSTSLALLMELTRHAGGVALLPEPSIQEEFERKRMVQVLPGWFSAYLPIYIVYPRHRLTSPKLKEMIPILERRLQLLFDRPSRSK